MIDFLWEMWYNIGIVVVLERGMNMEKTIDSSLEKKSESFTRRLVEFYTAEEWQAILGGFAENVARRTSTSTIWSLDETIELFKNK